MAYLYLPRMRSHAAPARVSLILNQLCFVKDASGPRTFSDCADSVQCIRAANNLSGE